MLGGGVNATDDLALNRPGDAVRRKLVELQPNPFKRAFGRRRASSELSSWASGLIGERVTGRRVNRLRRRGWYVLHAVQWPSGSDIDHLVIGPPGVFTINSKRHKGKSVWYGDNAITVNRTPTPHIAISQSEARRVARLLSRHCGFAVPVRPVIAVVHAAAIKVKNAAPPVLVVPAKEVDRALMGLSPTLGSAQVEAVYAIARNARNWHGG
ncbi:nuclease-related domain-containing protein [Streptomyces sp. NPDC002018]|uniref:nuclease-related domain-containing protein n=1 Tax=Streptomyces sp. NPDC002018 TaxID=3364629 RepID=UPI00367E79C9